MHQGPCAILWTKRLLDYFPDWVGGCFSNDDDLSHWDQLQKSCKNTLETICRKSAVGLGEPPPPTEDAELPWLCGYVAPLDYDEGGFEELGLTCLSVPHCCVPQFPSLLDDVPKTNGNYCAYCETFAHKLEDCHSSAASIVTTAHEAICLDATGSLSSTDQDVSISATVQQRKFATAAEARYPYRFMPMKRVGQKEKGRPAPGDRDEVEPKQLPIINHTKKIDVKIEHMTIDQKRKEVLVIKTHPPRRKCDNANRTRVGVLREG